MTFPFVIIKYSVEKELKHLKVELRVGRDGSVVRTLSALIASPGEIPVPTQQFINTTHLLQGAQHLLLGSEGKPPHAHTRTDTHINTKNKSKK